MISLVSSAPSNRESSGGAGGEGERGGGEIKRKTIRSAAPPFIRSISSRAREGEGGGGARGAHEWRKRREKG